MKGVAIGAVSAYGLCWVLLIGARAVYGTASLVALPVPLRLAIGAALFVFTVDFLVAGTWAVTRVLGDSDG